DLGYEHQPGPKPRPGGRGREMGRLVDLLGRTSAGSFPRADALPGPGKEDRGREALSLRHESRPASPGPEGEGAFPRAGAGLNVIGPVRSELRSRPRTFAPRSRG